MHLRGLDLNLLVALDALIDERNITRAGDRLHLSQSGMSTALARLRDFFGDQLLVPIGRRMVLTPLAEMIADPVREIILQAQTLIDVKPGFNPATASRTFTIMASDYVASVFLPRIAQLLSIEAPGVVLEIIPHGDMPHELLLRGEIDLLIMPEQYLSSEHPKRPLFSERYVCISWDENDQVSGDLSFETYLGLGHIVTRFGPTRGMAFDEWFLGRFERVRRIETVVMSFAMQARYVVGTQRLSTMHERLAREFASQLPIRIHELPFDLPHIVEAMQWNRFSDRNPALAWLRGRIEEVGGQFEKAARPEVSPSQMKAI